MSEKALQKLVTDWLSYNGFVVIETGQYIESQRPACTVGAPDIFFAKKGSNRWFAVELKSKRGKLRLWQEVFVDEGVSTVCRSLEDVQRLLGGRTDEV